MQFTTALFAAAALAVANAVQFTMGPAVFQAVQAGETLDITWANATGPVTILLKNGLAGNLQTVSTIACKWMRLKLSVLVLTISSRPHRNLILLVYSFIPDGRYLCFGNHR